MVTLHLDDYVNCLLNIKLSLIFFPLLEGNNSSEVPGTFKQLRICKDAEHKK